MHRVLRPVAKDRERSGLRRLGDGLIQDETLECSFDFGRGEIASSLSILRAICRCRLEWTVLSLALCPPPSPPSVQINRIALLSELTPARFRSIVIMIRSVYLPQLICRNVLAS